MYDDEEPKPNRFRWMWLTIVVIAIASFFLIKLYSPTHFTAIIDSTRYATRDELMESTNFDGPNETFEEITNAGITVKGNSDKATYIVYLFDKGKTTLQNNAGNKLQQIAKSITNRFNNGPVKVYCYADSTGSEKSNLTLTDARARAVKRWLTFYGGIAPDNVSIYPMGEENPIAPNDIEENRQLNRRVEIVAMSHQAARITKASAETQ